MKRILYVAIISAVAFAGALAARTARAEEGTMVIPAQGDPHLTNFVSILPKRGDLRVAIAKDGFDSAFSAWMRADHPTVYAAICSKMTREAAGQSGNTQHLVDFQSLLAKRSDLRAAVVEEGQEQAFMDWMRKERPDFYAQHDPQAEVVTRSDAGPRMADFISLLGKRGHLRVSVARKGLDAAFEEWLSLDHADRR